MEELNSLEKTVLKDIIKIDKENGNLILEHLPLLQVKSREYSGVGVFIHFEYTLQPKNLIKGFTHLSSEKLLQVNNREADIQHVLFLKDGLIDFLELVTWNDEWDGKYDSFKLIESE